MNSFSISNTNSFPATSSTDSTVLSPSELSTTQQKITQAFQSQPPLQLLENRPSGNSVSASDYNFFRLENPIRKLPSVDEINALSLNNDDIDESLTKPGLTDKSRDGYRPHVEDFEENNHFVAEILAGFHETAVSRGKKRRRKPGGSLVESSVEHKKTKIEERVQRLASSIKAFIEIFLAQANKTEHLMEIEKLSKNDPVILFGQMNRATLKHFIEENKIEEHMDESEKDRYYRTLCNLLIIIYHLEIDSGSRIVEEFLLKLKNIPMDVVNRDLIHYVLESCRPGGLNNYRKWVKFLCDVTTRLNSMVRLVVQEVALHFTREENSHLKAENARLEAENARLKGNSSNAISSSDSTSDEIGQQRSIASQTDTIYLKFQGGTELQVKLLNTSRSSTVQQRRVDETDQEEIEEAVSSSSNPQVQCSSTKQTILQIEPSSSSSSISRTVSDPDINVKWSIPLASDILKKIKKCVTNQFLKMNKNERELNDTKNEFNPIMQLVMGVKIDSIGDSFEEDVRGLINKEKDFVVSSICCAALAICFFSLGDLKRYDSIKKIIDDLKPKRGNKFKNCVKTIKDELEDLRNEKGVVEEARKEIIAKLHNLNCTLTGHKRNA